MTAGRSCAAASSISRRRRRRLSASAASRRSRSRRSRQAETKKEPRRSGALISVAILLATLFVLLARGRGLRRTRFLIAHPGLRALLAAALTGRRPARSAAPLVFRSRGSRLGVVRALLLGRPLVRRCVFLRRRRRRLTGRALL